MVERRDRIRKHVSLFQEIPLSLVNLVVHPLQWTRALLSNIRSFILHRYKYDTPFHFIVGSKKVPVGLSRGVTGMCIGEIREIDVPPHLGYGDERKGKERGYD